MKDINTRFKIGLLWSIMGQFGYLLISFITNLILARLLSPNAFGVIAIAYFFIVISKVFIESGLSGALIRKKNVNDLDYSTVFIFNLTVSVVLYIIIFISSPFIEDFYKIDNLSYYIRILSVVLIINSFQIVQNVRLVKKLEYKKISLYTLISIILSSLIALLMAYLDYGVLALIYLQILNSLILTSIFWVKEGSVKLISFSTKSFKEIYSFGLFTTLSSLLNTGFDNVYQLILGKYFNLSQTGFYYQAKKLTEIPVTIIKSTTLGVVYAALSETREEKKRFDNLYLSTVRIFSYLVGIICLIIFLFSEQIIIILYGQKWLGANFYMKIMSLSSFFYMQEMFNRVLFKVFNYTSRIFILEIIKKSVSLITLLLGVYFLSIEILMFGYLLTSILAYFMNYYVSRKIYITENFNKELFYTLKIVFTIVLISIFYYLINYTFDLSFITSLLLLPVVVIMYFVVLTQLKVFNFKNDLKIILSIKK